MAESIDIKIDLKSGRVYIDELTGDAMLIKNEDVVLQDAAIRLRTQIGTVQRMGLEEFGWNYLARIKQTIEDASMEDLVSEIKKTILQDDRVDDVDVAVQTDPITDQVAIQSVLYIDGNLFNLSLSI